MFSSCFSQVLEWVLSPVFCGFAVGWILHGVECIILLGWWLNSCLQDSLCGTCQRDVFIWAWLKLPDDDLMGFKFWFLRCPKYFPAICKDLKWFYSWHWMFSMWTRHSALYFWPLQRASSGPCRAARWFVERFLAYWSYQAESLLDNQVLEPLCGCSKNCCKKQKDRFTLQATKWGKYMWDNVMRFEVVFDLAW